MANNYNKVKISLIFLVSIGLIAFYCALFYPGYLTGDSIYILYQTTGVRPLSNWHPLFITYLFGGLYHLMQSTGDVWSVQILLYIGGCAILSSKLRGITASILLLIMLTVFPPLLTNMGALWKDCWAITATIFCCIAFINCTKNKNSYTITLLLLSYFLVSLIRIDYLIIILPFILLTPFSNSIRESASNIKKGLTHLFIVLLMVVLANQLMGIYIKKQVNPWLTTAVWDIAGIEQRSSHNTPIMQYNCSTSDPLVWGNNKLFNINLPEEAQVSDPNEEKSKFLHLWFTAIIHHPIYYIKHRLCVAKVFFGFRTVHYPFPRPVYSNSIFSQQVNRSNLNHELYFFFDKHSNSAMYRYWWYLAIDLLLMLGLMITKKITVTEIALGLSIFMSALRVLILPAADFRYGLWIVAGTIIFIGLVLNRFYINKTSTNK